MQNSQTQKNKDVAKSKLERTLVVVEAQNQHNPASSSKLPIQQSDEFLEKVCSLVKQYLEPQVKKKI